MDPEKKSLNFIFPTKYVIPKSLKFSNWLSQFGLLVGKFFLPNPVTQCVKKYASSIAAVGCEALTKVYRLPKDISNEGL